MLAFMCALALLLASPAWATHAYYVYDTDQGAPTAFEAMSITQVWDKVELTNFTDVYGSNEFFFENGITGYFGSLAEHTWNATTGKIGLTHGTDFAIWDFCGVPRYGSSPCTAGHKITSHPLDTKRCTRFGGEGTGAHCTGNVPMVKGREYTFHIELAMQNASGAGWNATVVDEYTGEEHILGALFLENTPHADQWLWDAALLNGTATGPAEEQKRATRSTARGGIAGYGGLTVLESGATHHAANRTDPVTGKTINLGGLSFMEYPVRPT